MPIWHATFCMVIQWPRRLPFMTAPSFRVSRTSESSAFSLQMEKEWRRYAPVLSSLAIYWEHSPFQMQSRSWEILPSAGLLFPASAVLCRESVRNLYLCLMDQEPLCPISPWEWSPFSCRATKLPPPPFIRETVNDFLPMHIVAGKSLPLENREKATSWLSKQDSPSVFYSTWTLGNRIEGRMPLLDTRNRDWEGRVRGRISSFTLHHSVYLV